MHITMRQLQVFEAVARMESFTRAAEELHLSQPAVSMQVSQLERQVGLPLFEQMGKRIFLTGAGNEMRHYARQILGLVAEATKVVDDMKGLRHGILDISVATTANDFAARLIAAFSGAHVELQYRLDVTNRETLLRQLEANEKDLVIMGRPPQGSDLEATPFMENPLVVIAAPGHSLGTLKQIPLSRLVAETFVLRERASGTRTAIERFFSAQGIGLTSSMEMTSNEAIKQAVRAGLGLGIVSLHTVPLELETGRLRVLDVQDFPILRHWYVVHRRDKRLSTAAQSFKQFVLARARDFADLPPSSSTG